MTSRSEAEASARMTESKTVGALASSGYAAFKTSGLAVMLPPVQVTVTVPSNP